ncbi:MAG: diguanylate cyclase [Wenzhouxiangella sp.]
MTRRASGIIQHLWLIMLILAALPAAAPALAPDQAFHQFMKDTWSIEEGLPQISAMAVVQGPDNYIWAATQAGLSRFDGARFTNYSTENTPELPGMYMHDLLVDSRDRIWIGTYKGAALYDGERFSHVADQQGREFDIFQFAEAPDGWVLSSTSRGLFRSRGERLERFEDDPQTALHSVFHHDGLTLAGGRGAIYHQDGSGWNRIALDGMQGVPVTGFAHYDGVYWAGTGEGLLKWTDGRWHPHVDDEVDLSGRVVQAMYVDKNDNFWISTAGALIRMRNQQVIEVIDDNDPSAHGNILSIGEDHEGNLWLGGRWDGLARLWNSWVLRFDRPEGLHNSLVWSLAPDNQGNLWVGTMDGLALFRDGRFEQLTTGAELPHPHAYTLLVEDDQVWIGTRSGLALWDRQTKALKTTAAFDELAGIQVNGILRHSDGLYWLGTSNGIWRWDGVALQPVNLPGQHGSIVIRALMETSDGILWAGTVSGLLRIGPDGSPSWVEGVPDTYDVTALTELRNGRIVAGTLGERLLINDGQRWHDFGIEDGLPINSGFAIAEHGDTLWVAGLRGIYELSLAALDSYIAGEIPTLPGRMVLHERGDVSGAQTGFCCNGAGNAKGFMREDGFWLPTRGGVIQLAPDRIARNPHPPAVAVERLRVQGRWQELANQTLVRLSRDQRDLAFGFTVLSFQDPGSIQLEYRLLGYSDEWLAIDDPHQRVAFYTNLPAGEFTFEVRGTNNADVWSEQDAQLHLVIEPRLRETTMFWVLIGLAFLGLAWLVLAWKIRSLKAQRKALERTVAERTLELSQANDDLMDYSRRLKEASMTDQLTGLWNRRYLVSQLPVDLAHFRRELLRPGNEDQVLLFGLLDIDHFKPVNDHHGHAAGDAVLQQLATLLISQVREGDYVVRWGGEEFLLVFRPMLSDQPAGVAERLRSAVEQTLFEIGEDKPLRLTCSIGMAEYPVVGQQPAAFSWEDVGAMADQALYHIKNNGRNGWCLVRANAGVDSTELKRGLVHGLEHLMTTNVIHIETGFGSAKSEPSKTTSE